MLESRLSHDGGRPLLRAPAQQSGARAPGAGRFADTRWSLVLRAADGDDSLDRRHALEALCTTYWPPLYAWLRSGGHSPEDAEDLVQTLFVHLLTGASLARIGPERGKFRTFLLAMLKNLAVDQFRRKSAAKRGAGEVISLDLSEAEAYLAVTDGSLPADTAFDRNWARTLVAAAVEDLRATYRAAGREALFDALQPHVFGHGERGDYARVGEELGLSRSAVTMSVMRMRERMGELIMQRVADTVPDAEDVREEMRYLLSLFACA